MLPILTFSIGLAYFFAQSERRSIEEGLQRTTRALAAAVDRELLDSVHTMDALAASSFLDDGRLREFYDFAQRVRENRRGWQNVLLHDPARRGLLSLVRPFGTTLRTIDEDQSFTQALRTRKPAFREFRDAPISGPSSGIRTPVIRDGEIKYVLTLVFDENLLQEILKAQRLPRSWVGTILDQDRIVLARTHDRDRLVGRPASVLLQQIPARPGEGWLKGADPDGVSAYAVYNRSGETGWTVAITVPANVLDAPLNRSLLVIAALGILSIVLAVSLAIIVSGGISRFIRAVTGATRALGEGAAVKLSPDGSVLEARRIAEALTEASVLLHRRGQERDSIEADLRRLGSELESRVDERTRQLQEEVEIRKSAEETLRRQAELLELAHEAIFVCDFTSRRITFWNRGAADLYGWSKEEALGKVSHELLQTKFPVALDQIHAALLNHGRWDGEIIHAAKKGAYRTVESRWSLRRDAHGHPSDILQVSYDITARTESERKLRESERLATLGTTAAVFAHEIANPLNGICAALQLLNAQLHHPADVDVKLKSLIEHATDEIHRLVALLRDFRSFARPQQFNLAPIDLAKIVEEIVALEDPAYHSVGIRVQRMFSENLPRVIADREKIKQAILNVAKNAAEAMPTGGVLTFRGYESDASVFLEISDTGGGIPDGTEIFQLFRTTKPQGSGLGLPISAQILSGHNGSIEYTSRAGKGTTFKITLRAETLDDPAESLKLSSEL